MTYSLFSIDEIVVLIIVIVTDVISGVTEIGVFLRRKEEFLLFENVHVFNGFLSREINSELVRWLLPVNGMSYVLVDIPLKLIVLFDSYFWHLQNSGDSFSKLVNEWRSIKS